MVLRRGNWSHCSFDGGLFGYSSECRVQNKNRFMLAAFLSDSKRANFCDDHDHAHGKSWRPPPRAWQDLTAHVMCLSPVINLKKVHNGKRSDLILSFHFFLYRCHSISHKLQQLQVCSRLKKSRRNGPLCGVFAGTLVPRHEKQL